MLLHAAFAGFNCGKCRKLERSAFPPEQSEMTRNSALLAVGALVLLGAVMALLVAINS